MVAASMASTLTTHTTASVQAQAHEEAEFALLAAKGFCHVWNNKEKIAAKAKLLANKFKKGLAALKKAKRHYSRRHKCKKFRARRCGRWNWRCKRRNKRGRRAAKRCA